MNDCAPIDRFCSERLVARQFTLKLLARQSAEPLLTEQDLDAWDDIELLEVAAGWWQEVDKVRPSPVAVESFEGFQSAVRQRNAEHSESLKHASTVISETFRTHPEMDAMNSVVAELDRYESVLGLTETSMIQKALQDINLGGSAFERALQDVQASSALSAIEASIRSVNLAAPDLLVIESIQERARELALFTGPAVPEWAKAASVPEWAKAASWVHPAVDQVLALDRMAREMSEHFRTFENPLDSALVRDVLSSFDNSAYKQFLPDVVRLESVAASFDTAWIDKIHPDASIAGIARITALTAAAHSGSPFDLSSVATLREALGDWRTVELPWTEVPDSNLREKFYLDQGFDANLIRLPEPAFTFALRNVDLVRTPIAPAETEVFDEEEILHQRMRRAYGLFLRLERKLREYIDRRMTEKYGAEWERHRCHGNGKIYELWVQKREKAVQSGFKTERLIHYADFTEYADLMTKSDNWDEVFKTAFGRPENVRESFHRLAPVRLCTMHARPITKTEFVLAWAEITRLLSALGVPVEEDDDN